MSGTKTCTDVERDQFGAEFQPLKWKLRYPREGRAIQHDIEVPILVHRQRKSLENELEIRQERQEHRHVL